LAENIKYIITKDKVTGKDNVTTLIKNKSGFWCDSEGTLYSFVENDKATDLKKRCGVWPFALPLWGVFIELNEECAIHDNMYGMPVFQAYNGRSVADAALDTVIESKSGSKWYRIFRAPIKVVVRLLGGKYWDNSKTRDL